MFRKILNKISFIFYVILYLIFNSCNNDQSTQISENENIANDYYQFQELSLEDYDIPAFISLPDETANIGASTKPIISHIKGDIKWSIQIGANFELLIEDYGYIDDLIEVKKQELLEQTFFQVNYLIDEPDLILYERTLTGVGLFGFKNPLVKAKLEVFSNLFL